MIRFKRRNTLWLATLGTMLALVIMSSSVTAGAQALLLGGFMVALAASVIEFDQPKQLLQNMQQRSARSQMSPQAREAVDRVRRHDEYRETDLQILDIGVIATQSGREGMAMRRTRSISKDDDGARPFVTLFVPASAAERSANVRFEFFDQTGNEQYLHEMTVFLRAGEMNILTENHLPLVDNDQIAGMGDWDLRVYVNGDLMGIHSFALTASDEERRNRLRGGRAANQHYVTGAPDAQRRSQPQEEDEEIPLSLEELLRSENHQQRR